MRTEQLCREYDLPLRHTVFPLHPEIPEDGVALAELFAGRKIDLKANFERLRSLAAGIGLPFGERTRSYNSRRAQELGKWAEVQGAGDAFHTAVYRAYFHAGRNISQTEVLAAIAEETDLSADEALRVLREQRYAQAVEADWQRARELGVNAVPTFRYRKRTLVGFTSYQEMCQLLDG